MLAQSWFLIPISHIEIPSAEVAKPSPNWDNIPLCFIWRNFKNHNKEGRIKGFSFAGNCSGDTLLERCFKRKEKLNFFCEKVSSFVPDKTYPSWLSYHYWFHSRWRALVCWWCFSPRRQTEKVVWWVQDDLGDDRVMSTLFFRWNSAVVSVCCQPCCAWWWRSLQQSSIWTGRHQTRHWSRPPTLLRSHWLRASYTIKNHLKAPKAPTRGISCLSLVLYGIRAPIIGPFHAWKPTILMP